VEVAVDRIFAAELKNTEAKESGAVDPADRTSPEAGGQQPQ